MSGTQNNQNYLKKEEPGSTYTSQFQNLPQRYSDRDTILLTFG